MRNNKKWGVLAIVAAFSLVLGACGGAKETTESTSASTEEKTEAQESAVEKIQENGKIIMVTNAEFEPFEYKDGNETIGIDVDIAKHIADELGVELEIQDIAFDSCVPSVTEGRADFSAAGMTVTEERLRNVDFTDTYFNASQAIIVATDSDITSSADLNGKIVGVQQGTTGDLYVTNEDGENDIEVAEVRRYPKGVDAVSDLVVGRIDAVVIDNFPAQKLQANNADKVIILNEFLTEEEYAIAVPKGSDLCDKINEILADMVSSGLMEEIIGKYIDVE